MERPSMNTQLAVASLSAMLFTNLLGIPVGFAIMGTHPEMAALVSVNGAIVAVTLFALPLVWWRHNAGYVAGIIAALVNVLGNVAGIASSTPTSGEVMPPVLVLVPIFQTVFAVPSILFAVRAWREPR